MNLLLIYIVVIGAVFIFMTSRGNKKRQSQAAQLQSALVVGAQVRTIGGLVGEVMEVTDEHVVLETTPGVRLKFVKSAVAGVVPPEEPVSEEAVSEELEPAEPEPQTEATAETETEPQDAQPEQNGSSSSSRVEAALSRQRSGDS